MFSGGALGLWAELDPRVILDTPGGEGHQVNAHPPCRAQGCRLGSPGGSQRVALGLAPRAGPAALPRSSRAACLPLDELVLSEQASVSVADCVMVRRHRSALLWEPQTPSSEAMLPAPRITARCSAPIVAGRGQQGGALTSSQSRDGPACRDIPQAKRASLRICSVGQRARARGVKGRQIPEGYLEESTRSECLM